SQVKQTIVSRDREDQHPKAESCVTEAVQDIWGKKNADQNTETQGQPATSDVFEDLDLVKLRHRILDRPRRLSKLRALEILYFPPQQVLSSDHEHAPETCSSRASVEIGFRIKVSSPLFRTVSPGPVRSNFPCASIELAFAD